MRIRVPALSLAVELKIRQISTADPGSVVIFFEGLISFFSMTPDLGSDVISFDGTENEEYFNMGFGLRRHLLRWNYKYGVFQWLIRAPALSLLVEIQIRSTLVSDPGSGVISFGYK